MREGLISMNRIEVRVERLTEEAFSPFGTVVGFPEWEKGKDRVDMQPDCVRIPHADLWSLCDLDFNGRRPYVGWVRYYRRKLEFHTLESHLEETELLIPYAGAPSIFAVAPATPEGDDTAVPDPASVRAFLLDGTKGICFHRAVWHRHVYPLGEWTDLIAVLPEGGHGKEPSDPRLGKTKNRKLDLLDNQGVIFDLVLREWDHSPDIIGEVVT